MVQEVGGVVDEITIAWRVLAYYRENSIPLAQRNLELSRKSYQAGQATFLSVLEAQRFYLDTRRRAVEASQTASATLPELERVIGLPLPEIVQQVGRAPASSAPVTQPGEGNES
jgi:outer membrane protein TolC